MKFSTIFFWEGILHWATLKCRFLFYTLSLASTKVYKTFPTLHCKENSWNRHKTFELLFSKCTVNKLAYWILFVKLDETDIIKELYKQMDPTVTQPDTGDIKGDIRLSLKYNHKQQLLLVKVIWARDLVPRDLNGKSDPYAVLDLVPDV